MAYNSLHSVLMLFGIEVVHEMDHFLWLQCESVLSHIDAYVLF